MLNSNTKLKGNIILLITAIVWGISFISQTTSMEYIEPSTFNGIRNLLGAIVLLPFILFYDTKAKTQTNTTNKVLYKKTLLIGGIACGIVLCAAGTIQTYSMKEISGGKAAFITALYIIFVPILSVFFKKKLPLKIIPTLIVGIIGFYFLCMTNGDFSVGKYELYALACSVLFSIHIMLVDYFSPKVEGIKLACLQFFVCAAINITIMFIFEKPEISEILKCWFPIFYSGAFSCGVAYTLQIIGQKYTDPTSATLLMSLESVFAVIFCWILPPYVPEDIMSLREIFGCLLIFAAITYIQLPDVKNKTSGFTPTIPKRETLEEEQGRCKKGAL